MAKKKRKAGRPKSKVTPAVKKAIKAQRAPAQKKASKKKVGRKKKAAAPDGRLLNFKIGPKEHAKVKALAKQFTGGNVSAWVRFAVVSAKPSRQDAKALAA